MYMFAGGTRADKSKRDNYIILSITKLKKWRLEDLMNMAILDFLDLFEMNSSI